MIIRGPMGDTARELIFSVRCCLDTQLLPVLGQERLQMHAGTRDDLEKANVAE